MGPARVRERAGRIGPAAVIVVNRISESVPVDEQRLDEALAVLRVSRRYSAERVEAACGPRGMRICTTRDFGMRNTRPSRCDPHIGSRSLPGRTGTSR